MAKNNFYYSFFDTVSIKPEYENHFPRRKKKQ